MVACDYTRLFSIAVRESNISEGDCVMRIVIGEITLEGTPQELAEYDRLTGGEINVVQTEELFATLAQRDGVRTYDVTGKDDYSSRIVVQGPAKVLVMPMM
jgi:hypothetical protein